MVVVLLDARQKRAFVEDGYLVVPRVVSAALGDRALRMINAALGDNKPDRVANYVFTGHENCDPLQHAPQILGLLTESQALSLAEELTEPGELLAPSCCQVATRFPEGEPVPEPGTPDAPHIDGIPNRTNGLPAGQLFPFSVLVGVYLSDLTDPNSGNFVVWPGSHRTIASYARAHPEGWFDAEGYGPPPIGLPPMEFGRPIQVTLRAGDIVLAHYQLAHSVAQNVSPHIRYAVYFRLAHRDIRCDWSQFGDLWRCHPAVAGFLDHTRT